MAAAMHQLVAVRSLVCVVTLLLVTSGCSQGLGEIVPSSVVRGHYIWGAEVNVFSACGSDTEHWVTAESETMSELRERYSGYELPPYKAVFVEVVGEFGPVLDCGFCEAYDGSFRVSELLTMESPGPESCVTEMGGENGNGT